MSKYGRYFASDPDWENFMKKHPEYALKDDPPPVLPSNIVEERKAQAVEEAQWTADHPLESFGYTARLDSARARDGYVIPIKIYHPLKAKSPSDLPLLYIIHAGGWRSGSYVSEETWTLYPIFQNFEFTIISVDYRLAPEHKYPVYINDCWDALRDITSRSEQIGFDPQRLIIAGSSAGGSIAAVVSQSALHANMPIKGVILNVPVTCHPDYFPIDEYEYTSYDQCFGTLLTSSEMREIWNTAVPHREDGKTPQASPLLGEVEGLPPHLLFIAGQDPVRDEGLAYAEKLEKAGVNVKLHIYQGVPHEFAGIPELQMTAKFHKDLIQGVRSLFQ